MPNRRKIIKKNYFEFYYIKFYVYIYYQRYKGLIISFIIMILFNKPSMGSDSKY